MTTATEERRPAPPADKPLTYVVRAQHDGSSHYLVREAGNVQTNGPAGVQNATEVLTLGVHTTSCCPVDPTSPTGLQPGCSCNAHELYGSQPHDDAEILRFSSQARAEEVAARANLNAAGYIWYAVPTEWDPPQGYVPPMNADNLAELEQRNLALKMQIANAENERLQMQLAAARGDQAQPAIAAPATVAATPADAAPASATPPQWPSS